MALLWIEGFEGFGDTIAAAPSPGGILGRKYGSVEFESSMDIEAGRVDGFSLEMANSNCFFKTPALTTDDTLIVGVAFKAGALLTQGYMVTLYDGANAGMRVYSDADGKLAVYRNLTRLATSTSSISAGV